MNKIIDVINLKKHFKNVKAVDDISFSVEKGEIFGFLGPNGAGKTTTIRCLMDFIRPSSGSIKILGLDSRLNSAELKNKIGYLPGNVRLYPNWTGKEHIDFVQKINGKSKILNNLLDKLNFDQKIRTNNLSSGNKQKLGLILALMNDPEILILDEPTVGLDPLFQNTIYQMLEDLQHRGKTIFMSSHNLVEIERLCRRVSIIKEGKLIAQESIKNLHAKRIHHISIKLADGFNKEDFKIPDVEIEEILPNGLILAARGDINPIIKKLALKNVTDLEITHATLEEVFLEFYQ